MSCLFCAIAAGEIPSHQVWEDARHLAFLTIFPNTEAFTVVITKEHCPSYAFANDDDVLAGLVLAAKQVGRLIDKAYAGDVGRTGMMLEGFGVDHLHAKLFPMHGTARAAAEWEQINSAHPEIYFDRYQGYISSHDGRRADDAWLAQVAAKIRAAA
jgi:diadenosine tetraphosphate (Ap4A) HIT family hydrolase